MPSPTKKGKKASSPRKKGKEPSKTTQSSETAPSPTKKGKEPSEITPSPTKKEKKISAPTRLRYEINRGRAPEEAFIPAKNLVDSDTRTPAEKVRLLNWALAYTPVPWQTPLYFILPHK